MTRPEAAYRVWPSRPSRFLTWALELAGDFCGVRFEETGSAEDAHVAYGQNGPAAAALTIPHVEGYRRTDVPSVPRPAAFERAHQPGPFPFDLFTAMRFWLADEANADAPDGAFDEHDRLRAHASAQEELGLRETPVVNAYLLLYRHWLEIRLGASTTRRLPRGTRCGVVLSHDVDNPLNPGDPRHLVRLAARGLVRERHPASLARLPPALWGSALAAARNPGARQWLFDDVVDAEERHGFRSTFFFASSSRFHRRGHALDVAYDVSTRRFRRVCRKLTSRGAEVGLHIGYRAHESVDSLRLEKEALERAAGAEVVGSRHHYWHMSRPFWRTLEAHGQAGLRYDSSVAFNDAPGYRLGIAFPFRPWNPETERQVATVQVPPMVMDGAFFYDPGATVDQVLARMGALIDALKQAEGIAAIDWHEYTSHPASRAYRHWGEAYLRILELLASDSEVAVMTFSEALGAVTGRMSHRHPGA